MKKVLLYVVLVIISVSDLYSQKHDYHWKFGYTQLDDPDNTRWGSTAMDFNKYYESDFIQLGGSSFIDFENTCAIISDAEGNYLFSYNGIYIEDAAFNVMENGNNMSNSGDNYGDIMPSGAIVLPVPESSHLYALFHIEWGYYYDPDLVIRGKHLYYSVIDMEKNNGLGAVTEKKRVLLSDEVRFDTKIATTRHANGKDWWILVHGYDNDTIQRILYTSTGPEVLSPQATGLVVRGGFGQSHFSPDGSLLAIITSISAIIGSFLYLFEFDRCSGLVEHPRVLHYENSSTADACGICFSPNSKILYHMDHDKIYQFDTQAEDVFSSKLLVATRDNFRDTTQSENGPRHSFGISQLGPDGKIYISPYHPPVRFLTTIDFPNIPGEECKVNQHSIMTTMNQSMPYFANYRLGPIEGSPCDTLGIVNFPLARYRADQDKKISLQFRFTDLSDYEPASWLWDFGDGNTSTNQNPYHTYDTEGSYNVCLTVSNHHGSDTYCHIFDIGTTSSHEETSKLNIFLYPNPVHDYMNIQWKEYYPIHAHITLYTTQGREIKKERIFHGNNTINLSSLQKGIYFYRITDNQFFLQSGKIIKL